MPWYLLSLYPRKGISLRTTHCLIIIILVDWRTGLDYLYKAMYYIFPCNMASREVSKQILGKALFQHGVGPEQQSLFRAPSKTPSELSTERLERLLVPASLHSMRGKKHPRIRGVSSDVILNVLALGILPRLPTTPLPVSQKPLSRGRYCIVSLCSGVTPLTMWPKPIRSNWIFNQILCPTS